MSHSHGGSVCIPAAAQQVTACSSAWGRLCGGPQAVHFGTPWTVCGSHAVIPQSVTCHFSVWGLLLGCLSTSPAVSNAERCESMIKTRVI